jgi:hypothetical protein
MSRHGDATPGAPLRNLIGARSDPMRLLRGAELAERDVVSSVRITAGELQGSVAGSRSESYAVNISTPVTGKLPGVGSPIRWRCSCPDWGDPCKHAVAVLLHVAQRFDDDPDLVGAFVGSDPHALADATDQSERLEPGSGPGSTRSTSAHQLPRVAPLWAEGLSETKQPTTMQEFFGETTAKNPLPSMADPMIGPDQLRHLGPLVVDSYDLAPDIIRMYRDLRED